jgi:hypothetical protein
VLGSAGVMMVNAHVKPRNHRELQRYFEYSHSGVQVVADGLQEMPFGEYLVDQGVLDRYQLFRALQLKDRNPSARLGECAAALGYVPILAVEKMFERFVQLSTVTL